MNKPSEAHTRIGESKAPREITRTIPQEFDSSHYLSGPHRRSLLLALAPKPFHTVPKLGKLSVLPMESEMVAMLILELEVTTAHLYLMSSAGVVIGYHNVTQSHANYNPGYYPRA